MKKKFVIVSLCSLLIAGCIKYTDTTSDRIPLTTKETFAAIRELKQSKETPIQSLLYNPFDETIYALSHKNTSISLYAVRNHAFDDIPFFEFKHKKNQHFSCFQFDEQGILYAVMSTRSHRTTTRQLVKINRTSKAPIPISLTPMPQTPVSSLLFSGLKVALVCTDGHVYFYNLLEGQQLGEGNLQTIPGYCALYNEHFFTQNYYQKQSEAICLDIDFRTGEILQTYPLASGISSYVKMPMTIHKETFYLLRGDNLYCGTVGSKTLSVALSLSGVFPLGFEPSAIAITPGQMLYVSGYSASHLRLFYEIPFEVKNRQNISFALS